MERSRSRSTTGATRSPRMTDEPQEPLRRLEQRLSQASDAAERLIAEAARSAAAGRPPPAGWQSPESEQGAPGSRPGAELESLVQALQALRDLIPPDVIERVIAAIREVLLALRALIDFYLERLDRGRAAPAEIEDIPIE
jgi:hypothetical protein